MRRLFPLLALLAALPAQADIPATPVLTLYQFNAGLETPYYAIESFRASGPSVPAGTLAQGTSVVPCLVISNGRPLTDSQGTPYVGFQVVVDSRTATPAATEQFRAVVKQRQALSVANHHCDGGVRYVLDVRKLYPLDKAPFFDPPAAAARGAGWPAQGELDQIVRAFHNSAQCQGVNQRLIGRRTALERAWDRFIGEQQGRWSGSALQRAKHLDYTLRTAIFEGHLERGCNAYGACERNIIALSIRNRAQESCSGRQGCRFEGDFQGVSSMVSQYNIWDEFLTQVSGLTACFLRDDLGGGSRAEYYAKLRSLYEQNLGDVRHILFGGDQDLRELFPGASLQDVKNLRHYYHAPAMGKCFPNHPRAEYITGAIARRGNDFALLANTRIQVDNPSQDGYFFRDFVVRQEADRDAVTLVDRYPGFVLDGRKVSLRPASGCTPYGVAGGCRFNAIGRYRKTPPWLNAGKSLELICRVQDRGEQCRGQGALTTARVGGVCDVEMRPVAGVR
jgi:hypothetical protein